MEKEKIQEMYTEYQMLNQQLKQLHENLEALTRHAQELGKIKEGLNRMINIKHENETLIGFGSGIFLKGEIKDMQKVVMNVGVNIFVEKTIQEAEETVTKQLQDVNELTKQIEQEAENTGQRIQWIQEEFQKIKPD